MLAFLKFDEGFHETAALVVLWLCSVVRIVIWLCLESWNDRFLLHTGDIVMVKGLGKCFKAWMESCGKCWTLPLLHAVVYLHSSTSIDHHMISCYITILGNDSPDIMKFGHPILHYGHGRSWRQRGSGSALPLSLQPVPHQKRRGAWVNRHDLRHQKGCCLYGGEPPPNHSLVHAISDGWKNLTQPDGWKKVRSQTNDAQNWSIKSPRIACSDVGSIRILKSSQVFCLQNASRVFWQNKQLQSRSDLAQRHTGSWASFPPHIPRIDIQARSGWSRLARYGQDRDSQFHVVRIQGQTQAPWQSRPVEIKGLQPWKK